MQRKSWGGTPGPKPLFSGGVGAEALKGQEMLNKRAADTMSEIFGPAALPLTRVGLPVFDRDSNRIGNVAEASRVAFRVDVPWGGDLWLGYDVIETVLPGQYVQLIITRDQLDKFNVPPRFAAA